ncbi:N-acetyl sugar amidotransferase [Kiloniella majae]|uniref:N-acetyl sugar amidotransferase n=1 Tax=Kiloniella majae TaxID=1938558 RepID=UPI000A278001|nr:N-acetyl sugar amidotransferase [Kiloniella majae]
MNRPRLIPCLLLKHGLIVRSQLFKVHQVIGNPMSTVERFSDWNVDELIVLDISQGEQGHDLRRDDLQQSYDGDNALDVLREISKVCFMPLTFGGNIQTLEGISERLAAGADKITLNTKAVEDPEFVKKAAERYGSQCIVVSIDVLKHEDGTYEVYTRGGQQSTGLFPDVWAKKAQELGAGEIFLNSIDRDGSAYGYDLELTDLVVKAVDIPVITCGGVGDYGDFAPGILQGGASALSAANIFHFYELSYPHAKQHCIDAGIPMRPVGLGNKYISREPTYNRQKEDSRLAERMERAHNKDFRAATPLNGPEDRTISWCKTCVYPSISAAPMEYNDEGECTGCQMARVKEQIPMTEWDRRKELLKAIVEKYRCHDGSRYDCVVAVSGGKDSYFQTHVIKEELGLNPLLVTYNGNNWTEVGWRNMLRMKEVFDCDHVLIQPSITVLKKLNRLAFQVMGDMNWHGHVGIMTAPVAVAAQNKIPLVFYGEHGYLDLCGQFSMNDFPEISYRDRQEHFARGYEWNYFVGREDLTSADMIPWKYPNDQELFGLDLRGIFLGNYVYWESNQHTKMVIEKYGFEVNKEPFDRTYRTMSNLDDMHENGAHDYLKYIKFGYGRATDHTCKDIRAGLMGRDEAIQKVNHYDPVKPSDLKRWLEYVDMSENDFDSIADTFRDPRVWWIEDGKWKRKINDVI